MEPLNCTDLSVDPPPAIGPARWAVVDTETSSLGSGREMLECAVILLDANLATVEEHEFVPHHDIREVMRSADPKALSVNRYFERALYDEKLSPSEDARAARIVLDALDGVTIVGANPHFDANTIKNWLARHRYPPKWRWRFDDIESATAALLALDDVPSLRDCADHWGVDRDPEQAHTALGDARVTADIFRAIRRHTGAKTL